MPPRFLTEEACRALLDRASRDVRGGGTTWLSVESQWTGNLRWARNHITSAGDVRTDDLQLTRAIRGAKSGQVTVNRLDDASLHAAVRRAERFLKLRDEALEGKNAPPLPPEPYAVPPIWSEATYTFDADRRAQRLPSLLQPAIAKGMMAFGYLEVAARGRSVEDSDGLFLYSRYTAAQYSVTVRNPTGSASGWAGVDHWDWAAIDAERLSAAALDKCIQSQNPVAVEPGRYTAILEPQAVCDLFEGAITIMDRGNAEGPTPLDPYWKKPFQSKIGERILDERITISADPMDPALGFPGFGRLGQVYHAARWVEHGVLTALPYDRTYAIRTLHQGTGLPNSFAFRMSGGPTSLEEMIATTERGIYVTRFFGVECIDRLSLLSVGYTRDGTWFIDRGKISKAVKNFRFTESPMFVGNQVEQLGVPVRVFHPNAPVVVPALKVRDFNFSQLSDAI